MEALQEMIYLFHNRLKVLENVTSYAKAIFSDMQALKTRINGHDENLGVRSSLLKFSETEKPETYKTTVTLNNHHFATKMLIRAFAAYTKALRKYKGFFETYSRAF